MSSGVKDFLIGGVLIGASFLLPGGFIATRLGGLIAQGLFLYGSARVGQGLSRIRESTPAQIEGAKFNVRSTQAEIPIVYGEHRVGIKQVDVRIINSGDAATPSADPTLVFSDADDDDVLVIVGALALSGENGDGIESITDIRVDRTKENAITGTLSFSQVVSDAGVIAKYKVPGAAGRLKYILQDGADGQTSPGTLQTQLGWTTNFKGEGIAYGAFYSYYDTEIWTSGVPNITALVRGNKVWDPRAGGGAGAWAWSDNPALCILDYLTSQRYGGGVPYAARDGGSLDFIDEASFEDAATYCDDVVTAPGGFQQRFKMNGVVDTSRRVGNNLAEMLATCRGELVWENGVYRIVIRQVTAAETQTLSEDDIVGEIQWVRKGSQIPNTIEAVHPSEVDGDFVPNSVVWPLVGDTTFLDEDNGVENRVELALPYCTNEYQALQTIMVLLREGRNDVMANIVAKQTAYTYRVGDVVEVSHSGPGWVDLEMIVRSVSLMPDGLVALSLQQYTDAAYNLDTLAAIPSAPTTNLPDVKWLGTTAVIVDDGYVSQGEVSATTGTQAWKRRTRVQAGSNVESLRIQYNFNRPTVGGGSTPFSRDYTVDCNSNELVTFFLEDGAASDQEFWAQDDSGTTVYDTAFAITITPYPENALAGKRGIDAISQSLGVQTEDNLGIRLDAEIASTITEYALSNRDAWENFTSSAEFIAQEFTVGVGGKDIRSIIFRMKATGTPVGNLTCSIYSTNTTPVPDEPNTSLKIANNSIQADTITTDSAGEDVEFFFGDYNLAAGNYWAVLSSFPDVSNYLQVGIDSSAPSYGLFAIADEFKTWTSINTKAAALFRVNETALQKVPARDLKLAASLKAEWLPADGRLQLSVQEGSSGGGGVGTHGLTDHTDVALTPSTGSQGDVLYRAAGQWENADILTMGGDGTIAAPTYSWLTDPDTGFRLETPGEIRAVISGSDKLRLTSTVLGPFVDAGLDLGTTTERFATAYIDTLAVTNDILATQISLGDGIRNTGTAVTFDADGLTDPGVAVEAIDRFVMSDDGVNAKVAPVNIPLSLFTDDLGFTQNVEGAGITLSTTVGTNDTIALDYLGADSFIAAAPTGTIVASDEILFMDVNDTSNVKRDLVSSLPFTNNTGDVESLANATNGGLAVTDGGGPDITIALAVDNLSDHSGTLAAADRFAVWESGAGTRKIAASSIGLNLFNNNLSLDASDISAGTFATAGGTYVFAGSATVQLGSNTTQPTLQFWDRDTVGGGYRDVITVPAVEELDIGSAGWAVDILGSSVLVNGAAIGTVSLVQNATNGGLTVTNGSGPTVDLEINIDDLEDIDDSIESTKTPIGTDQLAFARGANNYKEQFNAINLTAFNDDLGYTTVTASLGAQRVVDDIRINYGSGANGLIGAAPNTGVTPVGLDALLIGDGGLTSAVESIQFSDIPLSIMNTGNFVESNVDETISGTYSFTVAPRLNGWLALQNETSANDPTAALAGYQTLYSYDNGSTFELRTIVGADLVRNIPLITGAAANDELLVSTGTDHEADWSGSGLTWNGTTLNATNFTGNGSGLTDVVSDSSTVTDLTTETATYYPMMADGSSGSVSHFVDASEFSYTATTDTLTAPNFSGDGSSLTGLTASQIAAGVFPAGTFTMGGTLKLSQAATVMTRMTNTNNTDLSWDQRVSASGVYEIRSVTDAGTTVGNALQIIHATGQMRLRDGSRLLPTFSFGADTNIGMYRLGSNHAGMVSDKFSFVTVGATTNLDLNLYQTSTLRARIRYENAGQSLLFDLGTGTATRLKLDPIDATSGRSSFLNGQVHATEYQTQYEDTGTVVLDWDKGNQLLIDFDSTSTTTTIDINETVMQAGGSYVVLLQYNSGSAQTVAWTGTGLLWANGDVPTTATGATAGDITVCQFFKTTTATDKIIGSYFVVT